MRACVRTLGLLSALLVLSTTTAAADNTALSAADQLMAAQKAGKPTWLLVRDARTRGLDAMRATVEAARKRAPHVAVVEMDRSQAANKAIVKRYGLAGARLPMVLVIAHNGAPGGGVAPGAKAGDKLIALLPSPRKADTLLGLFQRKAVFVVVGRPEMPSRATALTACRKAAAALKGKGRAEKAVIVEVDLFDKYEQGFLKVLGAEAKAKDVAVHVYGLSGRKTGVLKGAVTSDALVKSAGQKQECCPGGKCG